MLKHLAILNSIWFIIIASYIGFILFEMINIYNIILLSFIIIIFLDLSLIIILTIISSYIIVFYITYVLLIISSLIVCFIVIIKLYSDINQVVIYFIFTGSIVFQILLLSMKLHIHILINRSNISNII